jgi:hypothetical protein
VCYLDTSPKLILAINFGMKVSSFNGYSPHMAVLVWTGPFYNLARGFLMVLFIVKGTVGAW